jgi:alginate O-acetyltransferase complex protein AlgI
MLFNSLQFAVFFVVVTTLFFLLPHRLRGLMLLLASSYFYMAFIPMYILILVFTILIDYAAGILIGGSQGPARKMWLVMSIVANVGTLAFFKYFNFLNDTFHTIFTALHWGYPIPALSIILPIGLSFHTFQSMAYTVEVYRGHQEVERSLPRFALYVLFYPQLVAGPIERPQNLLPQFRIEHRFDYQRATLGLQLMAWGLFKKVAVADRIAPAVDAVYRSPEHYSGGAILFATYLYAIQIYCDFSGYSDMAIGAAQVMGFRLMRNFHRPYFSQSISEFWRRWHISLSTWFRDYLYLPLGGNRVSSHRRIVNLLIVFVLSGLWHGANWTFVVWGALNGVYLVASFLTAGARQELARLSRLDRVPALHTAVRLLITLHLIVLAWVFFRATSLGNAVAALHAIGAWRPGLGLPVKAIGGLTPAVLSIALLLVIEILQSRIALRQLIAAQPPLVRWTTYAASLTALLLLGEFSSGQQFIYFQF